MTVSTLTGELESSFELDGSRLVRTHRIDGLAYCATMATGSDDADPLGAWWRGHLDGQRPVANSPRRTVRTVDLFCGPGGLALGFRLAAEELGFRVESAAAVDQDAEAVAVYAANHATALRSTDSTSMLVEFQPEGKGDRARFLYPPALTQSVWESLVGNVDVVLAGPPCQGHSNLNNRTRRADKRNELYLTVPAMAIALEAPIVIIENVPAVLHDRHQVVQSTVRLLEAAGYTVDGHVLSAAKLGWPQARQRYFVVARRGGPTLPLQTVSEALAAEARDVMWAIGDLVDTPFDDVMHLRTDLTAENQRRIDYLFDNDLYELPPSERPECHRDGTTYNAVYGRLYSDRPAPTITTGFMTPGRGRYIHPTRRRVLTPREAARLQGFPDTYSFHIDPTRPPSKAKLSKWIGDAVPLALGHAAGIAALAYCL